MAKRSPTKAKKPAVSPEDQAMFLAALDGVTPLGTRDRIALPVPAPAPVKPSVLPPEQKLSVEGNGQQYTARAPGVSYAQVAELRTGRVRIEQTLDLHGETVAKAIVRLREFFHATTRSGFRTVLIVHGKGSGDLRDAVHHELLGACSGFVHALATAAPTDGGEGATTVVLRGRK